MRVSAKDGAGMADWIGWLQAQRLAYLDRLSQGQMQSLRSPAAQPCAARMATQITFSHTAAAS
jgi:hypothetical protein